MFNIIIITQTYDPIADPHEIIKLVESMSDEEIERNSKNILKKHDLPNTYCFTKSLGEALVIEARNQHNLPAIMFRPSIVVACWREPCAGYIDNINGPSMYNLNSYNLIITFPNFTLTVGLLIAGGKGVVRSMYIEQKSYGDFLPCDIAINAVFVCTWNFLEFK